MGDSGNSITSKKLWKLARNGGRAVSNTTLRYPYLKSVQRRPLSSIEYLRSVTGTGELNVDSNHPGVRYNERLVDENLVKKTYSPPLSRSPMEAEIPYEECMFPITSTLPTNSSNLRSVISVQAISACIRLGSMYSSAGYGWNDQDGKCSYHILDKWNECSHCPEKDKYRTLSQVLLALKPREEIVAFGYEAHKSYLSSAVRQRKKLIYKTNYNAMFGQNLMDSVSDGAKAMELDNHQLCVAVIRHFRQAVLNDVRKKGLPLMAPPIGKLIWTIVVDNDAVKKNIIGVLPDVPMVNCRVVLLRDITASSIAEEVNHMKITASGDSLRRYMSASSLAHSALPSSKSSFTLLNIGAAFTEVTFFTVNRNVLYPSTSKKASIGGQAVTDGFYKFLILMFGLKMLQTYKNENYEGHTDLLCAIEKAKRSAEKTQNLCLHLPFSFSQHFKKKSTRNNSLADYASRMGCQFHSASNSVILKPGAVLEIFVSVVNQMTALLREVLGEEESANKFPVYLTGGLPQNMVFQDLLKQAFPLNQFVPVENSAGLSLIGAIRRELGSTYSGGREIFSTLRSSFTIGVTAAVHCDRDAQLFSSPLEKGIFLCNAFVPFIKKDEYLTGKDHFSMHSFFAASPKQASLLVRVFFTENDKTGSVFEDAMQCVSQMQLHIPLEKRGATTGKLFVFQVIVRFFQGPDGITVTVKDSDGLVYGCCRVLHSVTY